MLSIEGKRFGYPIITKTWKSPISIVPGAFPSETPWEQVSGEPALVLLLGMCLHVRLRADLIFRFLDLVQLTTINILSVVDTVQ